MAGRDPFPRHAAPRLDEALEDSPVVLIHGPRQCGKTTLDRLVGAPRGYDYVDFDDDVARHAAETDPAGFVAGLPRRIIHAPHQDASASLRDRGGEPAKSAPTGHVLPGPSPAPRPGRSA